MTTIQALAVTEPKAALTPFEYQLGALGDEEVEVAVEYCGVCHSDLSMIDNEWRKTVYPLVAGHEVVGRITAMGSHVKGLTLGQRVGVGWFASSCLSCPQCLAGDHHLCAEAKETIVGRHGGFATHVRSHWLWAAPVPEELDPAKVGPLFCGGITVFSPLVELGIRPTDRVGVIGIGGLGHLAVKFLRAWGCEVTAFTSSESKREEALELGAHRVVNSRSRSEIAALQGSLDVILSTVNVPLDWRSYFSALGPKGRLHLVGSVLESLDLSSSPFISKQRSLSGSPLGRPSTVQKMLDFSVRHGIAPTTELFPMSKANEAIAHLREGKARYRIVLVNDLG